MKKILTVVFAVALLVLAMSTMAFADDNVAKIGETPYATLQEALTAADSGATITLLSDINLTEVVEIKKAVKVEGGNCKITTSAKKLFEVYADFDVSNLNMVSTHDEGRCIDTRDGNITVNIDDCTMIALNGKSGTQTVTVGGNSPNVTMNIKDSTIQSQYVGIIVFVSADITIENSSITAWGTVYTKPNAAGTEVKIVNSTLTSVSDKTGKDDAFAAIVVESDDITINVDAGSTIKVVAEGTALQAAVIFNNKASDITVNGNVMLSGTEASVIAELSSESNFESSNSAVIEAVKADGYNIESGKVVVNEWTADTDSGYYTNNGVDYGMMRFLFRVNQDVDVKEVGIKYIKTGNTNATDSPAAGKSFSVVTDNKAFYGDVAPIPQGTNGTYYAVGYAVLGNGSTLWSDIVECSVNWNRFFKDYTGGAQ